MILDFVVTVSAGDDEQATLEESRAGYSHDPAAQSNAAFYGCSVSRGHVSARAPRPSLTQPGPTGRHSHALL